MAEYLVTDSDMTKVADAIRAKGNTTDPLSFPDGMAAMINSIQSGGGGVDISFIIAVNNSNYAGRMILISQAVKIECDFTSTKEYTFDLSNPISINEFFNDLSVTFDAPNRTLKIMLSIIVADTGQSGLRVIIMRL